MNWVDLAVIGVLLLSGLIALARGLMREVLGVSAWVGAALVTAWGFPMAEPRFRSWLPSPDLAFLATLAALFLGTLIILSILANWIGSLVAMSGLGGLDRTLGLVFGLVRGAALVVVAYILLGLAIPVDQWPSPVLEARSLPLAYEGADLIVRMLPPQYRPRLYAPPPGRETSAAALMRAAPAGRALRADQN
jgi:membrane protein required for colicin V production